MKQPKKPAKGAHSLPKRVRENDHIDITVSKNGLGYGVQQHTKPCDQCPFRRESAPGWLGGLSADEFKWLADSDTVMPCHKASQDEHGHGGVDYVNPDPTLPQCAGRAIYWANQCKRPRDATIGLLTLPKDTETVFQWPHQFVEHHKDVKL